MESVEPAPHICMPYTILDMIQASARRFFIDTDEPPAANFKAPMLLLHLDIIESFPFSKCWDQRKLLEAVIPRILKFRFGPSIVNNSTDIIKIPLIFRGDNEGLQQPYVEA